MNLLLWKRLSTSKTTKLIIDLFYYAREWIKSPDHPQHRATQTPDSRDLLDEVQPAAQSLQPSPVSTALTCRLFVATDGMSEDYLLRSCLCDSEGLSYPMLSLE